MGSWFVLCILFHAFSSEVAVTLADDTVYAWDQAAKVVASDGSTGDYFGTRVSGLSSSSFLVGSYYDDDGGSNSGSVYVFTRSNSSSWVQSAKVVASDGATADYFGYTMADLNSKSFVAGAYGDDDMGSKSGSAYVFTQNDAGTWVQSAKIVPSDGATSDAFTQMMPVGLSDSAFAYTSKKDDDNGADTGSVYVFTSSGGSWVQDGKITQSDGTSGSTDFGNAVAKLSSVSLAVGSPDDDNQSGASSGSAYVFTRSNDGSWAQADKFESSDGASGDRFAAAMAGLSSSKLVVGAVYDDDAGSNSGSAYVFTSSNSGSWVQSAKVVASDAASGDWFSVLSLRGLTSSCFVSGARLDDDMGSNSGSVYVFTSSDNGSWVQADKVVASDGAQSDLFGINVAGLSAYTFIAGSNNDDDLGSNSGSAYVFTNSGVHTQSPTIAPPTLVPTLTPTIVPTKTPTEAPTLTPTMTPTIVPTFQPTKAPTGVPTQSPTIAPTLAPTLTPTIVPTKAPTEGPTLTPTVAPTIVPTSQPTKAPTGVPTQSPTIAPTLVPTLTPTILPTKAPTGVPTQSPTIAPTLVPTLTPTIVPTTVAPTLTPTSEPTLTPTLAPTKAPFVGTVSPTITPPVDPPRLTSVKFSSTGGILNIFLDSKSDRGSEAGLSATFSCSLLLDFEGKASYCSWIADDELKMILGGEATLVPGSNITMQTGVLRAYCPGSNDCSGWNTSPRHTVLASAPVNPVTPTLILSYVSKLGRCSDISVDASGSYGSGGRSMTFKWKLHHPQGPSFSILEAAINAQNTSILEISNGILSAGSIYNISVEANNFLSTSSKEHILIQLSKSNLPSIRISGGSTATAYRSSALSLFASASASACNGTAGGTLAYNWTSDDDAGLSSTASDPRYFKLPAYSLTVGRTYGFTATVVDGSTGLGASASVTVSVPRGDLIAGIAGGDRTVSNAKDLVLDASTTVDEDLADELPSPQNVSYLWGCQYTNGTLCQFDVPAGLIVNVTQDNLVAGETFIFTVVVMDGKRSSNASVSISILGKPLPDVSITTTIPSKVNPSSKLSLSATVTSDYSATVTSEWAVASDSPSTEFETSSSLEEAASTSLSLSSSMTSSVEVSHILVIATDELAMGNTYSLQISASYSGSSNAAISKVTIIVNIPPTPGSFEVDPETGYSLIDLFSFQASNWVDDSEDLPFQYQFGYINTKSESVILNSRGTSNKLSDVVIPQGSGVTYSATCFVHVYDIHSSYGEDTMRINVLPFNGIVSDLAILADNLMDTKLSSYDSSGSHSIVVAVSSSLDSANCILAPNCTELFREDCGFNGDHTCGDCLDGFVGPLDYTTECYTATSTCNNGVLDGGEADIDCGGGVCDLCATGSSCTADIDCEYALCYNSICAKSSKSCSNDCFGNGLCIHESIFGDIISAEDCLVDTGSYCSAVCNCSAGFYGDDCSYTNATWAERMHIRQAMLDYSLEAYDFTDIDSDSLSVASHSLNSLLGGSGELSATGLTSAANYTATLANSLAGLDSASTSAASLTVCLDSLISSGSLTDGNSFDAVSGAASTIASSLYSDLVAGEDATAVTSDDMAIAAAKYNLAGGGGVSLSVPQTDNQASVGGGQQTSIALSGNSTDLFTGLGDLSLSVASFSTNIYAAADATENDTSSGIVRLSLSTADAASGYFQVELTLQNYEEEEYILSNTTTYSIECAEGTSSSHVLSCNGANTTRTCAGEEETLAFSCTSAGTVPRCIIRNGDIWDSESCEVVWYNSTTTHCLCTFEFDEGRRLSDDDSGGFASRDVSSDVSAIGGQLVDNLSGFATPFTNPSVILENLGVFVTMGCVVGGVPFLAWFTSYLGRLWERKRARVKQQIEKKKKMILDSKYTQRFRKGKSHLDDPNQIDYNEFKKIWGSVVPNLKLGHVLYDKFSQSLISQHPWLKSFHISTPGWGKQQAVAISLVYCTTLMFWDATLYPLLFPSSANCSNSSMSSESDCESYGCTWDSDSGSCSAEEVDDSLESTMYLVIYSMVLTLPPCILMNKVVSKCIGSKPGENNKVEWQIENVNRGDSTWEFENVNRAAMSAHKAFQHMESDELGVEKRSVSMFSQASIDPSAPSRLDASQQDLLKHQRSFLSSSRGSNDGSLHTNSFSRLFPRPASTPQAPFSVISKHHSSGPKNAEDVLAKKDVEKRILTRVHPTKPGLDESWEKNQMEKNSVIGESLDEETLQMQSLVVRLSSFRGKIDDEAALSHAEKVAKRVEEELKHLEKNERTNARGQEHRANNTRLAQQLQDRMNERGREHRANNTEVAQQLRERTNARGQEHRANNTGLAQQLQDRMNEQGQEHRANNTEVAQQLRSRKKRSMRIAKTIRRQVIIALAHEANMHKLNAFERNEYLTKLAINDLHSIVAKVAVRKVNINEEQESAIWNDDPDKVLKKPVIPLKVKEVAGTTFVVLYCLFCAYYVCLFGINYGSTYTSAWMKTFFLGFIQNLAVIRPLKIAAIFFLSTRFVPQKLDIEELKAMQHYAAVAQLARRYPNLEISKIIIQKDYFPRGYNQEMNETKEKAQRIWRRYCTFDNILTYMVLAVGFTLLMLPDDLQDVISEGGICVAFNYILVACGAGKLNSDFALYLLIFIIVPLMALTIYYARKLWRKIRESETFTKFTETLEL